MDVDLYNACKYDRFCIACGSYIVGYVPTLQCCSTIIFGIDKQRGVIMGTNKEICII